MLRDTIPRLRKVLGNEKGAVWLLFARYFAWFQNEVWRNCEKIAYSHSNANMHRGRTSRHGLYALDDVTRDVTIPL